jgi:hypothetical protein
MGKLFSMAKERMEFLKPHSSHHHQDDDRGITIGVLVLVIGL